MNVIKKTPITVEHHCLDLMFAPTRLKQRGKLSNLMASIEQHGQLVPAVIVTTENPQKWILIDGYLRLNALQRLSKDTIAAEIWDCDILQALSTLLTEHQSRLFEPLEEALLLRELHQRGLSQDAISCAVGRDRSWVCRRLSLIEYMPESILQAVLKGKLSLWSAQRVLTPVARANKIHADKLLSYLLKNHISTRDLQLFYEHYQRAHAQERSTMVNAPDLFFKAQKFVRVEKNAKNLRLGPEGKWCSMLSWLTINLKQIIELIPQVLYPHQASQERERLLNVFCQAKTQFDLLTANLQGMTDDP
jgi:ParB family transcriptional regulator, chromosome partitioning protein